MITKEKEAELEAQTTALATFERAAQSMRVHDAESHARAAEALKTVKARSKALDTERKSITGPILDAKRRVDALFARALEPLGRIEGALRGEIERYHLELAAARVQAVEAREPVPSMPVAQGVSVRIVRKWRIVDPDRVPRAFCSPDPAKIETHFAGGGLEAIAGVEFYDDTISTVRT
jgi:hypothetical protein